MRVNDICDIDKCVHDKENIFLQCSLRDTIYSKMFLKNLHVGFYLIFWYKGFFPQILLFSLYKKKYKVV